MFCDVRSLFLQEIESSVELENGVRSQKVRDLGFHFGVVGYDALFLGHYVLTALPQGKIARYAFSRRRTAYEVTAFA